MRFRGPSFRAGFAQVVCKPENYRVRRVIVHLPPLGFFVFGFHNLWLDKEALLLTLGLEEFQFFELRGRRLLLPPGWASSRVRDKTPSSEPPPPHKDDDCVTDGEDDSF